jgi:hypothetical protein
MIDADLTDLYQVTTGNLNLAVKSNLDCFPEGFMFQLAKKEFETLRFQFAISNRGGRRYLPYAFTEHGVAMLSSVSSSQRAVQRIPFPERLQCHAASDQTDILRSLFSFDLAAIILGKVQETWTPAISFCRI